MGEEPGSRRRFRILVLVMLGGVAIAAALTYASRLAPEPARLQAARAPRPLPAPTGPPNAVVLRYLQFCVRQGWPGEAAPDELTELVREAPWGTLLPPREEFDAAVALAAQACGEGMSPKRWLREVEYFGGLHSALRPGGVPWETDPFRTTSAFGEGLGAGEGRDFVLALEPEACAPSSILMGAAAGTRLGITYGGGVGTLAPTDAAAWKSVRRMRVLSARARAFRQGDVAGLVEFVTHEDFIVRREALQALVRSGAPDAIGPVRRFLEDPEPELQYLAALGLAELGDPAAEPPLRRYLGNDEDFLDRYGLPHYRAVLALAKLGQTDVRPDLELMAEWDSPELFPAQARAVLAAQPAPAP